MRLVVHATDRERAAQLRDLAEPWLGEGMRAAELVVSHREVAPEERGADQEVRLTLHRPQGRSLHVRAVGLDAAEAAREAVLELGQRLAREAVHVRHTVVVRRPAPVVRRRTWLLRLTREEADL